MIVSYDDSYENVWDDFVLMESINGNFLQTRNFLNYHKRGRFTDASLIIMDGNVMVAVVPANEIDGGKTLLAHQGSTFGGIVIGKAYANTNGYKMIFSELTDYFMKKEYLTVELRMHNWLYSPVEKRNELLDYFFQINGFRTRNEVGFYIDLERLGDDFTSKFEKLKRRKLNKANKMNLKFRKLVSDCEVSEFHEVLTDNMLKFDTVPVHTLEELLEFKNVRIPEIVSFYGVFHEDKMIAGSMVFDFCDKKVFHTQYLASRHEYLEFCPNEYLYTNLIKVAKEEGYRYLSYGTSTLEHGNVYNESLGMFKEGFNTDSYNNTCYIWERGKE